MLFINSCVEHAHKVEAINNQPIQLTDGWWRHATLPQGQSVRQSRFILPNYMAGRLSLRINIIAVTRVTSQGHNYACPLYTRDAGRPWASHFTLKCTEVNVDENGYIEKGETLPISQLKSYIHMYIFKCISTLNTSFQTC